jgi:hypothetical protein
MVISQAIQDWLLFIVVNLKVARFVGFCHHLMQGCGLVVVPIGIRLLVKNTSNRTSTVTGGHIMNTILLIVLVLLLIGALPTWPHSANWGYYPSGGLGLVLLIVLILLLTGRLPAS